MYTINDVVKTAREEHLQTSGTQVLYFYDENTYSLDMKDYKHAFHFQGQAWQYLKISNPGCTQPR